MSASTTELLRRGLHALRRSGFWWAVGIVTLAAVSVAFWPSLEGTDSLTDLVDSSEDMMQAFGVQDMSTAAGYLDAQMYALMLPLLLSGLAIASTSAITAGDEDAGRLELLHALPVRRETVWLTRLVSALAVVTIVSALTAAVVAVSIGPFSLDGITVGRVVAVTFACGALAAFHGAVAYAVAGLGGSRGLAAGIAAAVLVIGYVASYLLPLSDALEGFRRLSPWYWAIGTQPMSDGISGLWLLPLIAFFVALVAVGTVAIGRRDIRSA
ncbi:MAG TPA: ABC transporter permease subunit [Acidimicrobiales bacterium]|nr:ABC transporter permease subunit [Acidimicrobiales bacterium]